MTLKLAPQSKRTRMDTLEITHTTINRDWKLPPFQRQLKVNEKLRHISCEIKASGVLPGVITLGVIDSGRDAGTYLLDGQHRIEGFKISGLAKCYADVRIVHFDSMADMGLEFQQLNSAIVRLNPDDILRALEPGLKSLQIIRSSCPFVGYGQIRRAENKALVSMSVVLRLWEGSNGDIPVTAHRSAATIAEDMKEESTRPLIQFLALCEAAWGRDPENYRLWSSLNLCMCMYLYRNMVLVTERAGNKRATIFTSDEFKRGLMALSASSDYVDWLLGRNNGDRDRSPAFARIRALFQKRLETDAPGTKRFFIQPSWYSGK